MKILLIITMLFISACGNNKKTMDHSAHGAADSIIGLMHKPMLENPMVHTQNPDRDFLVNMIPHHLGAILSSEAFLKKSTNAQLLTLASNIIKTQKAEITEFSNVIMTLSTNSDYPIAQIKEYQTQSAQAMSNMMTAMSKIPATASADLQFVEGMIPHHQSAVADAQNILKISTNQTVIGIANRIIQDQDKEITMMQQYLQSLKK